MGERPQRRIYSILHTIQDIWEKNPDLRLGQILVNAEYLSETSSSLFYVEDDKLHEGLVKFKDSLK